MRTITSDQKALLQFLQTGDQQGFNLLYQRYQRKVFLKCFKMLRDETWAKDACQEIFMRIFLKLSQFGHRSQFSSWLYAVTHNFCLDLLRKKERTTAMLPLDAGTDHELPDEVVDSSLLERKIRDLQRVMEAMPGAESRILLLKYRDQRSIKSIAGSMDISEGAVKMRINRAKARARQLREQVG